MEQREYQIYELSARAVISYAVDRDGRYVFDLDQTTTRKCFNPGATHVQSDNALFHQIVLEEYGKSSLRESERFGSLSDAIFYMDFSGIFDVRGNSARQQQRKAKARDLFRPEGVTLNFSGISHRYVAFERSGNMSRSGRLSFIRVDLYDRVRRRIMMDMTIGQCQLSKLYAYNGLMLSSGVRIDGIEISRPSRVIVIDNPIRTVRGVNVITVKDDGSSDSVREYTRVEKEADIEITCFDGEGLISKEYAAMIDVAYCGRNKHTSFQIRLPFVKGMLHAVDFKDFLRRGTNTRTITDIWGATHKVEDVDIILTKSMFKGFGWLKENRMSWADYWRAFIKYDHALYITNTSRDEPQSTTELNYQFLTTVPIQAEEFRPSDLPDGWDRSPAEDPRHWLTKQTELAYYNYRADEKFRLGYFEKYRMRWGEVGERPKLHYMASALRKNSLLIHEPAFAKILDDKAEQICKQYGMGRLIVDGDIRYLSGDLLDFLVRLMDPNAKRNKREQSFYDIAKANVFPERAFYAPKAAYRHDLNCTLLRNPHISRNEELLLTFYDDKNNMRNFYFGHLTDVVMVDSNMLAAERLGGADYDGDLIRTIADPILNACVRRNYESVAELPVGRSKKDRGAKYALYGNSENLPLLMIPSAEPLLRDANDWEARFDAVSSTFSSRIGQMCDAALDRSIIAYNENSDSDEREECRRQTETLAILTGLEIDSAKSGVKPNIDRYLERKRYKRNLFLQYRSLVEKAESGRRSWYEKTHSDRIKAFLASTDWSKVDSNVERLPYLAAQLKKHTKSAAKRRVEDRELFKFAASPDWKEKLDKDILHQVSTLIERYATALRRIHRSRFMESKLRRKGDVERILFARAQEDEYDTDELYAQFRSLPPERIESLHRRLRDVEWHLMDADSRERFLVNELPELADIHDLLADFRHGGFRLLCDILSDLIDENTAEGAALLFREDDPPELRAMIAAYADHPNNSDYRDAVAKKCREFLIAIVPLRDSVRYLVAIGHRDKLWDLVPEAVAKTLEVHHAE